MQHESVVRARNLPSDQAGELVAFTRQQAGWEWMSFVVTRLLPGQTLERRTGNEEMALVLLGGLCTANWGSGAQSFGKRKTFSMDFLLRFICLAIIESRSRRKRFVRSRNAEYPLTPRSNRGW